MKYNSVCAPNLHYVPQTLYSTSWEPAGAEFKGVHIKLSTRSWVHYIGYMLRVNKHEHSMNSQLAQEHGLQRKEVDDVLGGENAWDNVDRTEGVPYIYFLKQCMMNKVIVASWGTCFTKATKVHPLSHCHFCFSRFWSPPQHVPNLSRMSERFNVVVCWKINCEMLALSIDIAKISLKLQMNYVLKHAERITCLGMFHFP